MTEKKDVIHPGNFLSDANDHLVSPEELEVIGQFALQNGSADSPLELSRALQARLGEVRGLDASTRADAPQELTRRLRMNVEAMHVELAELLHETPWKEWKTYPEEWYDKIRMMAIKEEVIDLYFFLNNMFIALGMDDQEIQALYQVKFKKNMERQAEGGAYR